MRSLWKLTWMEMKLFLREPISVFFTLAFPLMFLFLFGSMYGNEPLEILGGKGTIDLAVPGYTAMIIATTGLMSLTITVAMYREKGVLRRLRATPLRPQTILLAQVAVLLAMTVGGMILLIIAGKVVYGLRFSGSVANVVIAFVLSCLSFFGLGFVIAGVMPNARAAQIVSMVLFYPMTFLTGATLPRALLPEGVQRFAQILPLTYVVNLLQGFWYGDAWGKHLVDAGILIAMLIVGVIISAKTFRWE